MSKTPPVLYNRDDSTTTWQSRRLLETRSLTHLVFFCFGGGRAHSLIACLSHLTIDHASLSRRSTVPARNRDTSTFGRSLRFFHMLHINLLLILSPSCFAVCGHHLSTRIAIALSLLSSVPYFSVPHSSIFLISSLAHRVPPCIFHTFPLCEFCSLLGGGGHLEDVGL